MSVLQVIGDTIMGKRGNKSNQHYVIMGSGETGTFRSAYERVAE